MENIYTSRHVSCTSMYVPIHSTIQFEVGGVFLAEFQTVILH